MIRKEQEGMKRDGKTDWVMLIYSLVVPDILRSQKMFCSRIGPILRRKSGHLFLQIYKSC